MKLNENKAIAGAYVGILLCLSLGSVLAGLGVMGVIDGDFGFGVYLISLPVIMISSVAAGSMWNNNK